jgi:methylthioribose-1-phosphate isomerase
VVETIQWRGEKVGILDQTKLPHEVVYIDCDNHPMVVDCIKRLCIRGAPAIGIAAAMGLALAARRISATSVGEFKSELVSAMDDFLKSRPTAVNIRWAVERISALIDANAGPGSNVGVEALAGLIRLESQKILDEDVEINKAIGRWGAGFIKDGARILTHCNAGSLATGGYGTATAPMRTAVESGKKIYVTADETRPVLQGARLTAWELMQDGIDVTLITDNAAGALMQRGEIDLCIVGTDRTVRNGDVANKIGTYSVAVLAKENNIPFYVAAPLSSIDFGMASGDKIPIEERSADEVTNVFGRCKIAPDGVKVRNPAFDVTPARYVTAVITEKGVFKPQDIHLLADKDFDPSAIRLRP